MLDPLFYALLCAQISVGRMKSCAQNVSRHNKNRAENMSWRKTKSKGNNVTNLKALRSKKHNNTRNELWLAENSRKTGSVVWYQRDEDAACSPVKGDAAARFKTFMWCFGLLLHAVCVKGNTPPHISMPSRDWIVAEDEAPGSVVTRLSAHDADNDQIWFSLKKPPFGEDGSALLTIDHHGVVRTNSSLMGKGGSTYYVSVVAFDGQVTARHEAKLMVRPPQSPPPISGLAAALNPGLLGASFPFTSEGGSDLRPPIGVPIDIGGGAFAHVNDPQASEGAPPLLRLPKPRLWKVAASAPPKTLVATLNAIAMSHEPLSFSIRDESNLLSINAETGEVRTEKLLLDQVGQHKILVEVGDKFAKIDAEIILQVYDERDTVFYTSPSTRETSNNVSESKTLLTNVYPTTVYDTTMAAKIQRTNSQPFTTSVPEVSSTSLIDEGASSQANFFVITKNMPASTFEPTAANSSETSPTVGEGSRSVFMMVGVSLLVSLLLTGILVFLCRLKFKSNKHKENADDKCEKKELEIMSSGKSRSRVWPSWMRTTNPYTRPTQLPIVGTPVLALHSPTTPDGWEFPRHKLRVLEILGEGCFGQVYKYEAADLVTAGTKTIVAVKTLKSSAGAQEKNDLQQELRVLKSLGKHPNVLSLLACCTDKEPTLLVLEYMKHGKLQSYLRDRRCQPYNNLSSGSNLSPRDLTVFALQVAKGMDYLAQHEIVHRDLAARNVLVGEENVCKVADFGFARDIANNHAYERKTDGKMPIRWMAVESLFQSMFTTKSDVWSFGVLLWEIVTLGSTPYPGLSASEVMQKIKGGYRLEKPEFCRREVYNIMFYCWEADPVQRPSFPDLIKWLEGLITSEVDYIELTNFPEHAYYNFTSSAASGELL